MNLRRLGHIRASAPLLGDFDLRPVAEGAGDVVATGLDEVEHVLSDEHVFFLSPNAD
jgi:hypothetical protein